MVFSIKRKEEQALVEAGREFQIEVAIYESEKEKPFLPILINLIFECVCRLKSISVCIGVLNIYEQGVISVSINLHVEQIYYVEQCQQNRFSRPNNCRTNIFGVFYY